jgi:hypothetical protein
VHCADDAGVDAPAGVTPTSAALSLALFHLTPHSAFPGDLDARALNP